MAAVASRRKPRLTAPPCACDTHMHFYDPIYALAATALGPPPAGDVPTYRALQQRLGTQRAVVVQPTAYGLDNRCTLEGIAALGLDNARGIAVVDMHVSSAHLRSLTEGGIRGARFQMLPGGAVPWEMLDTIAARVQDFGWHLQLQTDGRVFPDRERQIMSWPGRIVIDHVGKFLEPVAIEHQAFRCLLRFIETGRVWVKLSAPYEVSKVGPPGYDDVGRLAKAPRQGRARAHALGVELAASLGEERP
jgi:D-galactarolactone isomerase